MASENKGYWARSWELLTRDEGWYKPLLVLGAANLVPVVGLFGTRGYALEWARLTAWGVDSSPKQKGVDVGACIRSGGRAFVVSIGYGIVLVLLQSILGDGFLANVISTLLAVAVGVLIAVATLRATIYQQIGAGYQLNRIFEMARRDTRGLGKIVGMVLLMALVAGLLLVAMFVAMLVPIFVSLARDGSLVYADEPYIAYQILLGLGAKLPLTFVLCYVMSVVFSFTNLMEQTATGLWMRQFDVPAWGNSEDPLPSGGPVQGGSEYGTDPAAEQVPTAYPVANVPKENVPVAEPIVQVQDLTQGYAGSDAPAQEASTAVESLVDEEALREAAAYADELRALESLDRVDDIVPVEEAASEQGGAQVATFSLKDRAKAAEEGSGAATREAAQTPSVPVPIPVPVEPETVFVPVEPETLTLSEPETVKLEETEDVDPVEPEQTESEPDGSEPKPTEVGPKDGVVVERIDLSAAPRLRKDETDQ